MSPPACSTRLSWEAEKGRHVLAIEAEYLELFGLRRREPRPVSLRDLCDNYSTLIREEQVGHQVCKAARPT